MQDVEREEMIYQFQLQIADGFPLVLPLFEVDVPPSEITNVRNALQCEINHNDLGILNNDQTSIPCEFSYRREQ